MLGLFLGFFQISLPASSDRGAYRKSHQTQIHRPHAGADMNSHAAVLYQTIIAIDVTATLFLFVFVMLGEEQIETRAKLVFAPLVFVLCTIFTFAAILCRRGQYNAARLLTSWSAVFGIAAAIVLTGGAPRSVCLPLIVIPPIFFFCMFGGRAGMRAAFAVLAAITVQLIITEGFGIALPNYESTANPAFNTATVNLANFALVVLAMFIYERANAQLRRERNIERQRLADLANHDTLTGIANGRYLRQVLDEACERVDRNYRKNHMQVGLLFIDFNDFKHINDEFGHKAGDELLCAIATRLQYSTRHEDMVARLGGDEFVVISERIRDRCELDLFVERLEQVISAPLPIGNAIHTVRSSIGSVLYPTEVQDRGKLLEQADRAMYDKKKRDKSLQALAAELRAWETAEARQSGQDGQDRRDWQARA
ncbi:diguanylate cyclase [Roseiarcaceae bacterium H3SJ34-1]|uniref:diguanylate cyclase domain-containing protein n=1 Tax=Terripilifer ovatus TaxID=3032367 RepID=UPI003AB997C2|nr:diguanylate cyclase [Roseiarcaceae bacterium H3SJ34-1]